MAINLYLMIMIDENAIDLKKAYLSYKTCCQYELPVPSAGRINLWVLKTYCITFKMVAG